MSISNEEILEFLRKHIMVHRELEEIKNENIRLKTLLEKKDKILGQIRAQVTQEDAYSHDFSDSDTDFCPDQDHQDLI